MNSKNFLKLFIQHGLIYTVIIFLSLSCTLLICLFFYQGVVPENNILSNFYIGHEINIPFTLLYTAIFSVLIGILISAFKTLVPKTDLETSFE